MRRRHENIIMVATTIFIGWFVLKMVPYYHLGKFVAGQEDAQLMMCMESLKRGWLDPLPPQPRMRSIFKRPRALRPPPVLKAHGQD